MTELTLKLKYKNHFPTTLATMLQLSFPIWGAALPIAAVLGFFLTYLALVVNRESADHILLLLNCSLAALATTVVAYRLNKLVEKDWLLAEKHGIEQPSLFNTAYSGKHVPWSSIARV